MSQSPASTPDPRCVPPGAPIGAASWTPAVTAIVTRLVHAISCHWLFLSNAAIGVIAFLPVLPPALMLTGHTRWAQFLYALLGLSCHQLPERSFFLSGPRLTYTLEQLEQILGPDVPLRYVGDAKIGFKVAVCQRDVAIYLAMFVAGMGFALMRHRLRPLPWKGFVVMCVPMAVDGLGQLLGFWDSTLWSRVLSGSLFGVAWIWLVYPHVETAMRHVRLTSETDERSA